MDENPRCFAESSGFNPLVISDRAVQCREEWWRGLNVVHAIKVRLPVVTRLRNDFGQVVHTIVLLSSNSIIWYRSVGCDGMQLGR